MARYAIFNQRNKHFKLYSSFPSGKSTTSRIYANMINGTYLRSPLNCLLEIRNNVIAHQPRLIRSAFHALNNYLIAEKIKKMMITESVVIDQ